MSDLAIKLREIAAITTNKWNKKGATLENSYLNQAADLIEQQQQRIVELEAQMPKWISVDEELPDNPKEVLGLLSSGMLRICKYCKNKNIWMEAMSYERLYTVTRWMPQPPEGE